MKNQLSARIVSIGSYLPEQVLSNQDLEGMVETSDEWIVTRTGMRERRVAKADEFTSDMGYKAAELALKRAGCSASELDLIIVATMSPDYISPSTASLIQARLGAGKAAAFDIQAACTGFLYGLSVAKAFIESGLCKSVLLVAAEKMTAFMDYSDRSTCVLFGDGAAAALIKPEGEGLLIDHICLGADGECSDLLTIPAGGSRQPASLVTIEKRLHYFQMAGNQVFKHAVRRMSSAIEECLKEAKIEASDITWLIPHQANIRILDALAKQFNLPDEKIVKTLEKYGNTSASSVAIALDELLHEQALRSNDLLLLTAFGAGLTWGAAILRKA